MQMAAVIVCGGSSRRMGADKALLLVDGQRLLDRVAARVATVADPVLLAPGRPGRLGPLPWPEVADVPHGVGPAAGLAAGMREAAARGATAVAGVGVDLPDADPTVLLELVGRLGTGIDVAVPTGPGHDHWLHAVWRVTAADHLAAGLREGRRSFAELTQELRVDRVDYADDSFALNLNSPADVERYRLRPR